MYALTGVKPDVGGVVDFGPKYWAWQPCRIRMGAGLLRGGSSVTQGWSSNLDMSV